MNAIVVKQHGGPEVLKLEQTSQPSPGPGQVLVRVAAAGVNPVDTYLRSGVYPNAKVPYTPGMDCAGTVEKAGGQGKFKEGERVYTSGTITGAYAEFALCDEATVHSLPANASFAHGASLGIPYATAYRALFHRGEARPGETVLIHGATGGVGTACVQFARAAGLRIIGTYGSDEGKKLVLQNGAHHVLNHRSENYTTELMDLTGGAGVNLIIEMLANVNLWTDLTLLGKKGRVVVVGSRGKVEITPRDTMSRDAVILGMTLFNASPAELSEIHEAIRAGLENKTLRPVIGKELPLADAPRAHELVMQPGAYGKIVLIP